MCNLQGTIMDYKNVAQGKTTIPNVDDGEECLATDVRNQRNFHNFQKVFKKTSELDQILKILMKTPEVDQEDS